VNRDEMTRETDLSAPVAAWLESRGLAVYAEVPDCGSTIDLVGWSETRDRLVCVELKLSLTAEVQRQAQANARLTPQTYVAVPTRPRALSLTGCRERAVGVLRVQRDEVEVLLEAAWPGRVWPPARERFLAHLRMMEPGGARFAGSPTLAGGGAAQDCYERVSEYRAANPDAGWREVYGAVANHYANPRSLAAGMRAVQDRAGLRSGRTP